MKAKEISGEALAIYRRFVSLGGAEHIATPANIQLVITLCEQEKPKRILELGGGIGALSYSMLADSNAYIDIYEDNDFCKAELQKNLTGFEGRYSIIPTYRTLPPVRSYDLMIIDGGNKLSYEPEWYYLRYLEYVKLVFIEGYRRSQVAASSRALWAHCRIHVDKTPGVTFEGKFHKGGTLIHCIPSKSFLLRTASYLYARLSEDMLFNRLYKYVLRLVTGKK